MVPLSASIIIVTLDRADSLERTLSSLQQIRYPHFEVIVVRGPCQDHTDAVLAGHADNIKLLTIERSNISAARNLGLAAACGDVVVFIDDDAIPEPDWLEELLRPYDDVRIASVGGFIRDSRGFDFQSRYLVSDRFGDTYAFAEAGECVCDDNRILALTGTNFSVRRRVLLDIGGFDEEYIWFLDETDVCVRLSDAGYVSVMSPQAEIHHKSQPGLTRTVQNVPRTMYPQLRSKAYFCVRHNLGRKPLGEILDYLVDYIEKERVWKRDLLPAGLADEETVVRLIAEVEKGVEDGICDALRLTTPVLMSCAPSQKDFLHFPLRLRAEQRRRVCLFADAALASDLAAQGHEVTMILDAADELPRIDFERGLWVHRVKVSAQEEYERINRHRQFKETILHA